MSSHRDLELPLELVTYLSGDAGAGAGPSAPVAYPTESGPIVIRAGAVSLFTRDLRDEVWRLTVGGWIPEAVVAGDRVWVGPFDGFVMAVRVSDGRVVGKIPCQGIGAVYAVVADGVLLHRGRQLERLEPVPREMDGGHHDVGRDRSPGPRHHHPKRRSSRRLSG